MGFWRSAYTTVARIGSDHRTGDDANDESKYNLRKRSIYKKCEYESLKMHGTHLGWVPGNLTALLLLSISFDIKLIARLILTLSTSTGHAKGMAAKRVQVDGLKRKFFP